MKKAALSLEASELLIGKKIIEVGPNYVVLDNGLRLYLSDSEVDMLNS